MTADPNSLVSLLAVDQSVLLLRSGNDVSSDQVCIANIWGDVITVKSAYKELIGTIKIIMFLITGVHFKPIVN